LRRVARGSHHRGKLTPLGDAAVRGQDSYWSGRL
jgi:hypothetical protein